MLPQSSKNEYRIQQNMVQMPTETVLTTYRKIPFLKPWAYITSSRVLGGLITGGGVYPGGLISGI